MRGVPQGGKLSLRCLHCFSASDLVFCFVLKCEDLRLSVGFPSATRRHGTGWPKASPSVPFLHHVLRHLNGDAIPDTKALAKLRALLGTAGPTGFS